MDKGNQIDKIRRERAAPQIDENVSLELESFYIQNLWAFSDEVKFCQGTFAEIYMATIQLTGKVVAVKKIAQDKSVKNRELQIMKELHHQNIIRI